MSDKLINNRFRFWYLHPVLHVSIIDDLQDFLLLDGQFIWLRSLEMTNNQEKSFSVSVRDNEVIPQYKTKQQLPGPLGGDRVILKS